ncbi:hypothetical protein H310_10287 [Aphanomyces invadans]|uniref:Uncharacterized protein n=1 Tax=Aphanomyces invadans TaxID=157072 RepID=A0A024TSH4_9STRA|nr:hypothetical protein H310_10287 [Aphanomyces invadans]ETV96586.1 hypothetical protein H310_10287 [Aphanomyces invadans]|eukprot:XP_008874849.1 hypothetical protein H310_10287 [Aphanomyces invadans]
MAPKTTYSADDMANAIDDIINKTNTAVNVAMKKQS